MGESTWRKKNDPSYGRSFRGLVMTLPANLSNNYAELESTLDSQDLRSALLFWDRIDVPTNNIVHIGLDQDAQFLQDAGIISRTQVNFRGSGQIGAEVFNAIE